MGVHKKFNEQLFNENDRSARDAVMSYLNEQGSYVRENEDIYGPDLVLYSGLKQISYIECEVKRVWKGSEFPWDSVQLPERKAKFIRKGKRGKPIDFFILNSTLDYAIVIPDYAVSSSLLVEVPNALISSGEKFFQIPIAECSIIRLR